MRTKKVISVFFLFHVFLIAFFSLTMPSSSISTIAPKINQLMAQNQSSITTCSDLDDLVGVKATFIARINPWTWNITSYTNEEGLEELNTIYHPVDDSDEYITSTKLIVYTGQLLKLTYQSMDSEHTIRILTEETSSSFASYYKDVFGKEIDHIVPPQDDFITIYLQVPATTQVLRYSTNPLLSGAGGFGMYGFIHVIERSSGKTPDPITVPSGLNCNMLKSVSTRSGGGSSISSVLHFDQITGIEFRGAKGQLMTIDLNVEEGGPVDLLIVEKFEYLRYVNASTFGQLNATFDYYKADSKLNILQAHYTFKVPVTQTYFVLVENSNIAAGGAIPTGSVTVLLIVRYPISTINFFGIQKIGIIELLFAVLSVRLILKKRY